MTRLQDIKDPLRGGHEQEDALRRRALVLDLAPVLVRDLQDAIIYWSRGTELLYGFSKEEALGRISHELLRTRFPEPVDQIMAQLRAGRDWQGELSHIRREGNPVFVVSHWTPQFDEAGNLCAIVEVNSDITGRKRAEADRAKLAAIIDASEDPIVSKDLRGFITSWNASAQRVFGYTAEEIIGQHITRLIPPELQGEESMILARLRRGERIEHYETVRLAKDGRRIELSLTISPVRDASGAIVGASKIARDITRRKQAERALRDSERRLQTAIAQLAQANHELETRVQERTAQLRKTVGELEAFSYSLSHDLRAPLRSIQGLSEIALAECEGKVQASTLDLLQRVVRAAQRMDLLIRDVLMLAHMSRQQLVLAPVDLERVVRDILQGHIHLQPPRAQVTVDALLPMKAHETSLTQCLINLLGNAVKFVPPGIQPNIRIHSEPAGHNVRLWVEDNGIGIPREARERVFELFYRLHRAEEYEGTGIGLAIVKKAIERMGGQVGVKSELGQGSRFWIELPRG